jgi:beta-glucosidase
MPFPEGFLWGAAASGMQIEGQNTNSDWWHAEHADQGFFVRHRSGDAIDSYHRYREDIALVADLGLDTYRFSLEWPRIEPAEGEFSRAELLHYRRMFEACEEHGVTPFVAINHMTLPKWIYDRGSWTWDGIPEAFERFCAFVAPVLAPHLRWVITLNELNLTMNMGYRMGSFPLDPAVVRGGEAAALEATEMLDRAHRLGYDVLKQSAPDAMVGATMAVGPIRTTPETEDLRAIADEVWNGTCYETASAGDFLGVQSYTFLRLGPDSREMLETRSELDDVDPDESETRTGMWMAALTDYEPGQERMDWPPGGMGMAYDPSSLGEAVRLAHDRTGGMPLVVTENGFGVDDDARRCAGIPRSLRGLEACIDDGIDVRGYIHWSLFDNWEWNLGWDVHLGLVEVDRETFERRPKDSAFLLGSIARSNGVVETAA